MKMIPHPDVSSDLSAYDGRSIVLNVVSFLLPPLGLLLYLALMIAKLPQKAQSAGRSATFGVGAYFVYLIVFNVFDYASSHQTASTLETEAVINPPITTLAEK